ncbi:16S rRNA methyltransferase, partial [Candidatus Woesearchaeota archaeon CG08_land_8_20_14_0_20_47_9]
MLKIETELLGRRLRLYSGSSVFSKSGIDLGTRTLIENACIKPGWLVLDLGCGYGAVGIAIAKAHPSCRVVMTDINRRAV